MLTYYAPGTVLNIIHMLTQSILSTALQGLKDTPGGLIKYRSTNITQTGGAGNSEETTF